ncbi:FecR family protein [Persicitalea jodogahamensis]|uniref:Iron dicitrate transporter FecR n=1 Tax=Persicitalea jodogahamensis TaxID=402147 RepID=A0A8J3GBE9_9BACT|nr:FecR domain-containing protein [Persicitalea jodogahamensis]GHB86630.1 iron dicitrate transporter FecR [Persicitalea jodogahamensis]
MTQQKFNQLLKRYLAGQTTAAEEQFLLEWYEDPANKVELNLTGFQKETIKKRMWNRIRPHTKPAWTTRIVRLAWTSAIAACFILGWIWVNPLDLPLRLDSTVASMKKEREKMEVKNTNQSEREVLLPDGSKVTLNPGSRLSYDPSFNQSRREVTLTGEAFFKVKRDETRPFVVHTGELVTEVLGTSFRIKQNSRGKSVEVSVREGKVSVYAEYKQSEREHNGVIITQNQRVLFDAATQRIVPGIVEAPLPLKLPAEAPPTLVFQETPFEKVLAELSRLYGIEFVISNPAVKDCRITADLHDLSMFTQLDLVCKSVGATYDKRGTVVFINGDGC